jgi:hypothetical protein
LYRKASNCLLKISSILLLIQLLQGLLMLLLSLNHELLLLRGILARLRMRLLTRDAAARSHRIILLRGEKRLSL